MTRVQKATEWLMLGVGACFFALMLATIVFCLFMMWADSRGCYL